MNTKNKLKIGFSTLAIAAFMTTGSNSLYAACDSECRADASTAKNGWCGPAQNGSGKACSDSGTGDPECNGTWTPVKCADE